MRFRFALPTLNVILAAILFHIGDLQTDKVMEIRSKSGFVEPVPDSYARARYLDYALNTPAWATLGEPRAMLRYRSTYWTGRDLRYFLALILMWYWLGLQLDNKFETKKKSVFPSPISWWGRALALMWVLY